MSHYSKDPYWTTARFAGVCAKTGLPFKRGDRIFYYPNGRQCFAGQAAVDVAADFSACAQDEAFESGGYVSDLGAEPGGYCG